MRLRVRTVKGWERCCAAAAPFGFLGFCSFIAAGVANDPGMLRVTAICFAVVGVLFLIAGPHPWTRR